jgi:thiamine biosynthesis lipoprotein
VVALAPEPGAPIGTDPGTSELEVMGTTARVLVRGAGAGLLAARARDRLRDLERRWSRFRADSEISRMNAASGLHCVSRETFTLVERAVWAWRATGGRFDPTVLDAVVAAGYDRSFELLAGHTADVDGAPAAVPGCAGIVLVRGARLVHLPPGVHLDPGGIGKGLAADLVAEELRRAGATAACVDVGGDVRVFGAPATDGWSIDVEDPATGAVVGRLGIADGAAATSSRVRRRWQTTDGPRHHLVDPATGRPAATGVDTVTVVAGEAWRAEVLAKAALLGGPRTGAALVAEHGAAALLLTETGERVLAGDIERFLA